MAGHWKLITVHLWAFKGSMSRDVLLKIFLASVEVFKDIYFDNPSSNRAEAKLSGTTPLGA